MPSLCIGTTPLPTGTHAPLLHVLICTLAVSSARPMTLPRVTLSGGPIRAGEKIELAITDMPTVANLYNLALIRLDAEIIAPDGKTTVVPGFAQERCERQQVSGETRHLPTGGYDWKGRCAAPSAGNTAAG